jgi:hypothetical protein
LGEADLGEVDLGEVDLGQVDLGQVDLDQVHLGQVDLDQVDLGQVDLGQVGLFGAHLFLKACILLCEVGAKHSDWERKHKQPGNHQSAGDCFPQLRGGRHVSVSHLHKQIPAKQG